MTGSKSDQRLALEEKLARVESNIEELKQKRVQLKHKINDRRWILKLPPAISKQLFMATFPKNSFSSWDSATPYLFGAVCHKWRELAWSFPLLWSSLSLTVKRYSDTKNNLLQEWLTRAGDVPLSIHLRMLRKSGVEPDEESDVDGVWKIMDIIARCSEQWQAIDFHLLCMFDPKICSMPTQFPHLVSMSICQVNLHDDFIFRDYGSKPIVWNAPKLQCIYMDRSISRSLDFHLSPNEKTSFSWRGSPCSRRCLEILKEAPNLVKCQFEGVKPTHYELPSVTALQLETLEIQFRFTTNGSTCSSKFLDRLTIPAIRELSISEHSDAVPFPSKAFISLISRSACHLLRRLSLSSMKLPPDQLANCLSATPSLTELRLEDIKIMSETFKDLSVDGTSQNILLPNLESFIYVQGRSRVHCLDFAGLIMMARSRLHFDPLVSASLQHVAKLKSIHTDFSRASVDLYLDGNINRDIQVPEGSNNDELGKAGGVGERDDTETDRECTKLNRHLIARFRGLIGEGMDIQILGHDNTNLLKQEVDMS